MADVTSQCHMNTTVVGSVLKLAPKTPVVIVSAMTGLLLTSFSFFVRVHMAARLLSPYLFVTVCSLAGLSAFVRSFSSVSMLFPFRFSMLLHI